MSIPCKKKKLYVGEKIRINVPLMPRIRTQIRHFTSVKAAHLKPPGDTCLQLRLGWWPRRACIIHGDIFKRCMTPRSPSLLREIRRICECNFSRTSRDSCPTLDPSAFVIDSLRVKTLAYLYSALALRIHGTMELFGVLFCFFVFFSFCFVSMRACVRSYLYMGYMLFNVSAMGRYGHVPRCVWALCM